MRPWRVFIALDIPPAVRHAIRASTAELRTEIGSLVRWVAVENIHLTLKFLGEVPPAGVDALTAMLRTEADACLPLDMHFNGLASFPSLKRPRVICILIHAPVGLKALQRGIESACTGLGFAPEARDFSPHLTIGRVRNYISAADSLKIRRALESSTIDSLGSARVDSVQLYKSDLKPDGAVYTRLFSAPLQAVAAKQAIR